MSLFSSGFAEVAVLFSHRVSFLTKAGRVVVTAIYDCIHPRQRPREIISVLISRLCPSALLATTMSYLPKDSTGMGERDIELGHLDTDTTPDYGLQQFFQEVRDFEMLLGNVGNIVHKLKEANQQFKSATGSATVKEIKGRMEEDIDEVREMAHTMKAKLRKMIRNNVENRKKPGCEKGTAIDISRISLIIALKTKLKEIKSDLQNLGKAIQQEYLEVIQRRISTVTGIDLSDDEVIRAIDAGSIVQTVENKLQGIGREQIVAAVEEFKERHTAGMDLNKKLLELKQVFAGMASYVDAKEKLDNAVSKEVNKVQKKLEGKLRSATELNGFLSVLVIILWLGYIVLLIIHLV